MKSVLKNKKICSFFKYEEKNTFFLNSGLRNVVRQREGGLVSVVKKKKKR